MSEPEGENLKVVTNRIALGIGFGCIVLSIIFSIWTLAADGGGPVIGVLIFNVMGMSAIGWIIILAIKNKRYIDFDRV